MQELPGSLKYFIATFLFMLTAVSLPGQITTYPYSENFDSGNGGWSVLTVSGTAWEQGTPIAPGTQGAYSAPNAWGTDLDSGYRSSSLSYLISPLFEISALTHPYLTFYQFRHMPFGLDGMHVEYTADGSPWTILGTLNAPNSTNWYNTSSVFATGMPGFTGNSNAWLPSGISLLLPGSPNNVRLRFVFSSNTSFGSAQAGVFLDNVTLLDSLTSNSDIQLSQIISPLPVVTNGNIQDIRIAVTNLSATTTIDTVYCGYILNGNTVPPLPFSTSLLPGQSDTLLIGIGTFNQPVNYLCAFASIPNDSDPSNDSACVSTQVFNLISIPYFEDFDSSDGGWTQFSAPNTTWEYGSPNYLTTNTAHSGAYCWDTNLDTAYGSSAYSILYTPFIDISSAGLMRLSFWRNHVVEGAWDGTRLEYSTDYGNSWSLLGSYNDPLGINWYNYNSINSSGLPAWSATSGGWKKSSYTLMPLLGENSVAFRFIFTSDPSVNSQGISIDDFRLEEMPDYDIELVSCATNSPFYPLTGTTDSIYFTLRNNGALPVSNFTCEYSVNGIPVNSLFVSGNLLPTDTLRIALPGFTVNQVSNNICGKVILAGDADTSNNYSCFPVTGMPTYVPTYEDNFDNGNNGWVSENAGAAGTLWELGVPAYGLTSGVHSSPLAWDINLFSPYANSANCRLYSPVFDISSSLHPKISFWQNRNAELSWDGLRLEYRIIGDTTWYVLGTLNDTNAINWYNDAQLNSSQKPGWTGNSMGWIQSEYNLDAINTGSGLIQLRYVFTSDFAGNSDGVSIDDFKISTVYTNDAALISILSPGPNAIQGASTPVEIYMKNAGSLPVTNLDIKYSLNGGSPVTYTWNGNLAADSIQLISLPSIIPIGGPNDLVVYLDWPSDLYLFNDTVKTSFFGIVTAGLPYFYDFENGSNGWGANLGAGNTNWELGSPSFPPLNTNYSGSSCWDINLTMPYFNLAQAVLTSPIFDLSPYNIITLQFWTNYSSESNADGMYIEFSNNGNTWQRLGSINDPLGTNWYNSTLHQNNQGWSGFSNGWQSCSYEYTSPWGNSYFQIRFKFISDFNLVDAGFSIDDVSLSGITSIKENGIPVTSLSAYPNPADEEVEIYFNSEQPGPYVLEIMSVDGKIIDKKNLDFEKRFKINTSVFPEGLYLLRVMDAAGHAGRCRIMVKR